MSITFEEFSKGGEFCKTEGTSKVGMINIRVTKTGHGNYIITEKGKDWPNETVRDILSKGELRKYFIRNTTRGLNINKCQGGGGDKILNRKINKRKSNKRKTKKRKTKKRKTKKHNRK